MSVMDDDPLESTETVLFGREELELPDALVEQGEVFREVLSQNTWDTVLSESQRRFLSKFLPPTEDAAEKQETTRKLFAGENFKFGNPLKQFQNNLKEGFFSPDIAKYAQLCRKAKHKDYRYQQQRYYSNILREILVNRQKILSQVSKLPPEEHVKMDTPKVPPKEKSLNFRVKKKYYGILREVREECAVSEVSSDEEELFTVGGRSKKAMRTLFADPPPEPIAPSVLSTLSPRPITNGELGVFDTAQPARLPSPVDYSEDEFKDLLRKHKKRRQDNDDHPEMDVGNISLQQIIMRTQPNKRSPAKPGGLSLAGISPFDPSLVDSKANIIKDKNRPPKKKKKKSLTAADESAMVAMGLVSPPSGQPENLSDSIEKEEEIPMMPMPSEAIGSRQTFGQYTCFFGLLRDFILDAPEAKITTPKLEEKVREWQDSPSSSLNPWFGQHSHWTDLVLSALKFLSGDVLGLSLENFIPLVDYKERAQQWKWIAQGRDSDEQLLPLCTHWLENRDDVSGENMESSQGSPPPPRVRTSYVVRPSTKEEKQDFHGQEIQRFTSAHTAYTYSLHGYEAVVGPVKGVYGKESAMNKAREHALLISDRPAYVTILTLVRDAAARLPNGEGTRADICELLKDSMYLAPGVTDAQINTVVSGALDRLHYEKDPCVKYDVNRKLWIYLHRCRTEEEFERIHQAQGQAAKAKKALQKPKAKAKAKEIIAQATAAAVSSGTSAPAVTSSPPVTSVSSGAVSAENTKMDVTTPQVMPSSGSPARAPQSPKGPGLSPKVSSHSPRTQQQQSPKVITTSFITPHSSPKGLGTGSRTMTVAQIQAAQEALAAQGALASATQDVKKLRGQEVKKQASLSLVNPGLIQRQVSLPGTPTNAPVTMSLIQPQASKAQEVTSGQQAGRTVVITTRPELAQKYQGNTALTVMSSPQTVSAAGPKLLTTSAPIPRSSPSKPGTPPTAASASKPVMARIVQHISSPQVMSVGNLIANTVAAVQKQGATLQGTTTIKIQAQNDGSDKAQTVGTPEKPQPQQQQLHLTIPSSPMGGKPITLGKPIMIGGKPAFIGGKPVHITGKPIQFTGKPSQMGLLQGQTLSIVSQPVGEGGNLGTPQTIGKALNQGTVTTVSPSIVGQILQSGGGILQQPHMVATARGTPTSVPQSRMVNASPQGGIVVTQLAPTSSVTKPGTPPASQGKLVTASQAGMLPTQILVQPSQSQAQTKVVTPQQFLAAGARPTLITTQGGKPAQNIQLVRTVVSQPGGKPTHTTIVISQAGVHTPITSSGSQVTYTTLPGGKLTQAQHAVASGASPRSKAGPVYARIITPPPGIRLAAVRPAQTIAGTTPVATATAPHQPGVSVIQTVGTLQSEGQDSASQGHTGEGS